MASIKAFMALRPSQDLAQEVAELPYDVISTKEAQDIAKGNDRSFFHVTRPEIDLDAGTNPYSKEVYLQGKKALTSFIHNKTLIQEEKPCLYLYTQIMGSQSQTGLVACVNIDDYIENRIKKHEFTRQDKEEDRTRHLDILNGNTGPVFLLYKEDGSKNSLYEQAMSLNPVYDFTAEDGIQHTVRLIDNDELISKFTSSFSKDILYIADGHHRAASAVNVGKIRREDNPNYTGTEEFNSFLTVIFPHNQLNILAYNRVIRDLNGNDKTSFLNILKEKFEVSKAGIKVPTTTHSFSMYLDKEWYTLTTKFEISSDPIDSLDVKILQDHILAPTLGIEDPRTSKRIDFIGGIRGTEELEKLVNSGDYAVAFSLHPTTVEQLMNVSDADGIMPPKSTWFEPKLRSGLFTHLLD